jgi:predicted molibdopterin-dependent oxidoreductase YjgC
MDRRSAYMGHQTDVERTKTTCMGCPVGCGIEAVARDNLLLRVEGDWEAANHGLLCVDGRFAVVEPQPGRLASPLVRRNGALVEATWDEALDVIARGFRAAGSVAGLASPRATNEELAAFRRLFAEALRSDETHLLYGELPPRLAPAASLADLMAADYIVLAGGQPLEEQKVLGYTVRRTVEHGATLVLAGDAAGELAAHAPTRLPVDRIAELPGLLAEAQRVVVLYGGGLPADAYEVLQALPRAAFLPLYTGTNAAGAAGLGLVAGPVQGKALFVLAADENPHGQALPQAGFTVVQSAYRTAWTEEADVVLPAHVWSEKKGHIVNIEGRSLAVVPFLKAPQAVQAPDVTFAMLTERMARPLPEELR